MLPMHGGHSGSGTITSSPGSSSAWQIMKEAVDPAGRDHHVVRDRDRDAVPSRSFSTSSSSSRGTPVVCR